MAGRNCILLIVADRVRGEGGSGNPGAGLVVEPDECHHDRAGGALLASPLLRFVKTWMVEKGKSYSRASKVTLEGFKRRFAKISQSRERPRPGQGVFIVSLSSM